MKPLCIYHGNCPDGFTAAWVVYKYFEGLVDFQKGIYGEDIPGIEDRDVILVDFSYKRHNMIWIADNCNSLLVLDHHASAEDDLRDLRSEINNDNVNVVFNMEMSGAGLAWSHFFPERDIPPLVSYVEDADLWKFNLPESKAVNSAIRSFPYSLNTWNYLAKASIKELCAEGRAILRKHDKDIEELLVTNKGRMTIGGFDVPVANMPYTMASDAGHILCKNEPFSATYYDTPTHKVFSLRSDESGEDVSKIAFALGGGGHKHSAGFRVEVGRIQGL